MMNILCADTVLTFNAMGAIFKIVLGSAAGKI